jgi:hypothetical protein
MEPHRVVREMVKSNFVEPAQTTAVLTELLASATLAPRKNPEQETKANRNRQGG